MPNVLARFWNVDKCFLEHPPLHNECDGEVGFQLISDPLPSIFCVPVVKESNGHHNLSPSQKLSRDDCKEGNARC